MDFKHFNVHWISSNKDIPLEQRMKGKALVIASDKENAKALITSVAAFDKPNSFGVPFEAEVVKVIGPLGMHESTDKQKLAHHYRWILGNITSAKAVLGRTKFKYVGLQASYDKVDRAYMLVDAQIAKLQRDVRDLFKIAGLKVK